MSAPMIIPAAVTLGSIALQAYQIRNLQRTRQDNNPFEGRITYVDESDPELYRSPMNTPVMSNITFQGGQYTDNNGEVKTFPELRYEAVLMRVSLAKLIVRTQIQGRPGTVKEYIGEDDYVVELAGIITGPNGRYPAEQVRDLKQMLNAPIPIVAVSTFLQNLDINNLVVESYDVPQDPGGYSYQQFNITFISDSPIELKLSQNG